MLFGADKVFLRQRTFVTVQFPVANPAPLVGAALRPLSSIRNRTIDTTIRTGVRLICKSYSLADSLFHQNCPQIR